MATILRIDSSIRTDKSVSRYLTGEFVAAWRRRHPQDLVIERDLAAKPLPHLDERVVTAVATPQEQRTPEQMRDAAFGDRLIEELVAADVIVLGAPMYNFSISSSLKAWIDHIARAGVTFRYTSNGPVGLLHGKKAYVFTARGGVYSRGPAKAMDFHETYLRGVLSFMGITDAQFVHTEGLAMSSENADAAIAGSRAEISSLLAA